MKKVRIKDLTVDIGILMIGSGIGNPDHGKSCRSLMKAILSKSNAYLTWDKRGKIKYQYEEKMIFGTYGHHWLALMASGNKLRTVDWKPIDRGTLTKLKELHFDSRTGEDMKYVRTAAVSECKILVSRDPDYSRTVRKTLKRRLSILVMDAVECLPLG